jgi:hypothetical protein
MYLDQKTAVISGYDVLLVELVQRYFETLASYRYTINQIFSSVRFECHAVYQLSNRISFVPEYMFELTGVLLVLVVI